MFRFPFGTVQELNLDWFLEQWEIFKVQAREAFEGIDHALDDEIDRVEDAMSDLYAARDAAIAAKNAAETAEGSTLGYAQSAANSAASAAGSAAGSATSASSSAGSAQQAAQSAQTSAQQASSAATSAGNAATSASNASSSAATAASNATIATTYSQESAAWATGSYTGDPSLYPVPSTAPQHENNAKYYADSAADSATAAAGSATAAAGSATDAAASAASVSASAAQIAQNTSDIADLQTDMTAAESAITDLQTDLNAAESDISGLQTDMTAAESAITDLQTDLNAAESDISGLQTDMTAAEDDLNNLKEVINGNPTSIVVGAPTSGKYYNTVLNQQIALVDGGGAYYSAIDLSNYIGETVRVKYTSESIYSSSTRGTAVCDANGIVGEFCYEREIYANGFHDFEITVTYNQLYISHSPTATDLSVEVLDKNAIANKIETLYPAAVYVSTNGNDNNSGTYSEPFATIQKAINSNAETVKVFSGEYTGFRVIDREMPLTIVLAEMPTYGDSTPDVPKIKITSFPSSYGIEFRNCNDISISDIWADGNNGHNFYFSNCNNIKCTRCYSSDNIAAGSSGFALINCNGEFYNSKAWGSALDGFNIHGYGNTQFIDCVAYNCGDDGISHHEGCTGLIIGGEYYGNGKGGVSSPTYGAEIDIENVYCHENKYGLYAVADSEGAVSCKSNINNSVFKNNTDYDLYLSKGTYTAWNIIYDTKQIFANATFTEIT